MSFGRIEGSFDIWNHPYMQLARREMVEDMAERTVCHPRCPHYRNLGYKPGVANSADAVRILGAAPDPIAAGAVRGLEDEFAMVDSAI
jgi:hypothetical protein